MFYTNPSEVVSPKGRWKCTEILINTGQDGWSAAKGEFDDRPVIVLRWNGNDADQSHGNPQSRGHATWFVLPSELADDVERKVALLSKTIGLLTCKIERPDNYHFGAYRIQATLAENLVKDLCSPLRFPMPAFKTRHWIAEPKFYTADNSGKLIGQFVDGQWLGDLYTNGCEESANPVSIEIFRDAFIRNVTQAIRERSVLD